MVTWPLSENTQLRQYGNAKLQTYCGELAEQQRPLYHVVLLELKGGIVPLLKAIPSEEQMNTWNWTADRKSHLVLNDHWLNRGLFTRHITGLWRQWLLSTGRNWKPTNVHVCQFLFSFLGKQEVLMIFFPLLKKNAEILNVIRTAEFLKSALKKSDNTELVAFSNPFESMYIKQSFSSNFSTICSVAWRCVDASPSVWTGRGQGWLFLSENFDFHSCENRKFWWSCSQRMRKFWTWSVLRSYWKRLRKTTVCSIFPIHLNLCISKSPFPQTFLPFVALRCVLALLCVIQICSQQRALTETSSSGPGCSKQD